LDGEHAADRQRRASGFGGAARTQAGLHARPKRQLAFFAHFEIDIISALTEQLLAAFEGLDPEGLTPENLAATPTGQGVYHLYKNGVLVYVGKASNLRKRLSDHRFKIIGRRNIDIAEMSFTCLTIHPNWTALAPEDALIRHYKAQNAAVCEWNGNSFGPHDPGRDRETTNKATQGFDTQFPIRDDWPCAFVEAREWNIRELLIRIKDELPFLLRYDCTDKNYRLGHPAYNDRVVVVPQANMGTSELLRLITQQIPGWQSTRFPSHMILYPETRDYVHGAIIQRQPA